MLAIIQVGLAEAGCEERLFCEDEAQLKDADDDNGEQRTVRRHKQGERQSVQERAKVKRVA